LAVQAFVPCDEVDPFFFDKPYYLAPSGPGAEASFSVLRNAMARSGSGALAVLFRRYRTVLIRPSGAGMVAHTLHFDYKVRSAVTAFEGLANLEIKGEMLDLAKHIISTKAGKFELATFVDRYETAVADLVKAKIEGRQIEVPKQRAATNVVNLLDALRASAGVKEKKKPAPARKAAPTRKAG
jgi:DNA end-binding protein Ku